MTDDRPDRVGAGTVFAEVQNARSSPESSDMAMSIASAKSTTFTETPTREIRRLMTLLEASQALSNTLDLRAALHRVLEILGSHHRHTRTRGY